jgi:hypothetical protein
MPVRVTDLETLDFQPGGLHGVDTARLPFEACEIKVVRYQPGAIIPRHRHSAETLKIVLKGRLERPGDVPIESMNAYECGGYEYGPWPQPEEAEESTYVLLIQPNGTRVETETE